MALLDAWKASLFKRVMTLSKDTDFRAGVQKEPEGPLRFSLFDPFDSCEEGSLARVGGDGDGTELSFRCVETYLRTSHWSAWT